MLILMKPATNPDAIALVCRAVEEMGLVPHPIPGATRVAIGVTGNTGPVDETPIRGLPGVVDIIRVTKPYKLTSREMKPDDTVVVVSGIRIGEQRPVVIAGPCSVETREQTIETAKRVKEGGAHLLRGGAFKPRTSPYTFQGKGEEGLAMFRQAADKYNLPIVTELMDARMLDAFLEHDVDVIQIGTRSMQNFELLKEVGRTNKPVILKRGMSATISEWLMAAEYIAAGGNHNIIFCERGIRSFETAYRNVMDVTCIPVLKKETHLPVIVDPSHAGGKAWMVPALARAAIAAGADGLLVEMHPNPCEAWCDADQALNPQEFKDLMGSLKGIAEVIGRSM